VSNVVRIVIAIVAVAAAAGGAYYYVVRQQVDVKVEVASPAPPDQMSEEERLKAIKKRIGSIDELKPLPIPGGPPKSPAKPTN